MGIFYNAKIFTNPVISCNCGLPGVHPASKTAESCIPAGP